jgi:hypothetical protein
MRHGVKVRGIATVLTCLSLWAGTASAQPPKVTKSRPVDGATEVPRDVGVLLVFFDRNMKQNQWTLWTSEKGEFPPLAAPEENPWRDPRTLELRLEPLKAGTTYAVQLNSAKAKKQGFRSAEDDEALPDTVITFTTNSMGLAPTSAPPGPGPTPPSAPVPEVKPESEPEPAPAPVPNPPDAAPTAATLAGEWKSDITSLDAWTLTLRADGTFELSAILVVNEKVEYPTWKGRFEVTNGGVDLRGEDQFFERLAYTHDPKGEALAGILSRQLVNLKRTGVVDAPAPEPGPAPAPAPAPVGPKPGPKNPLFGPRPAVSPLVGTWVDDSGAVTVVLKADGTFSRVMRTETGEQKATGTWVAKDGALEVKTAGEDETLRLRYEMPDRDTISLTADDGSLDRLRRVGTGTPAPAPGSATTADGLAGEWFAEDPTGSMRLDLKADGTHASVFANAQGRRATTGTWTAQNGTLTLRLLEVNQVLAWPFTQPDKDTLQLTLPGGLVVSLKRP